MRSKTCLPPLDTISAISCPGLGAGEGLKRQQERVPAVWALGAGRDGVVEWRTMGWRVGCWSFRAWGHHSMVVVARAGARARQPIRRRFIEMPCGGVFSIAGGGARTQNAGLHTSHPTLLLLQSSRAPSSTGGQAASSNRACRKMEGMQDVSGRAGAATGRDLIHQSPQSALDRMGFLAWTSARRDWTGLALSLFSSPPCPCRV